MDRRRFLKTMGVGTAGATLLAGGVLPAEAAPAKGGVKDEGVGTYTDPSVASQVSNFTINREMISCGVGTMAGPGFSGPFAMLMYSTRIGSYAVNRRAGTIRARGRMRSITKVAGSTVEDVEHDFIAVAVDGRREGPDRFDVHFETPFWNLDNPMATASEERSGWCRFGGEIVDDLGLVVVSR